MALADETATLTWALATYRRSVLPRVRAEQVGWATAAQAIPEPLLRRHALSALRDKAGNVEAVAVFALLAPRTLRSVSLRAIAALQVAIDFLDTLEEAEIGAAELPDDGGYLRQLEECRRHVGRSLPSYGSVSRQVELAVERCKRGQRQTHAAAGGDVGPLRDWADSLGAHSGYRWWEVAAGASSSVAAHALIATAANQRTSAAEAEAIDATYFPPVGALTVLLDDLVDRDEDRAAGEHNYLAYYTDEHEAARRLGALAGRARGAIGRLRRRRRHAVILSGVAAFYLGKQSRAGAGSPIRSSLLETVGPTGRLALAAVRRYGDA